MAIIFFFSPSLIGSIEGFFSYPFLLLFKGGRGFPEKGFSPPFLQKKKKNPPKKREGSFFFPNRAVLFLPGEEEAPFFD